jgi:hypothetical protein
MTTINSTIGVANESFIVEREKDVSNKDLGHHHSFQNNGDPKRSSR